MVAGYLDCREMEGAAAQELVRAEKVFLQQLSQIGWGIFIFTSLLEMRESQQANGSSFSTRNLEAAIVIGNCHSAAEVFQRLRRVLGSGFRVAGSKASSTTSTRSIPFSFRRSATGFGVSVFIQRPQQSHAVSAASQRQRYEASYGVHSVPNPDIAQRRDIPQFPSR